jgi:hypothetical protein
VIESYLRRIRRAIEQIVSASVEFYIEQLFSPIRANLRSKLNWPSGTLLEVSEAMEVSAGALVWLSYRYHFQDDTLLLRYDNAPHYPGLATFPEHRHQGTKVTAVPRPDLEIFFQEVRTLTGLW